MGFHVQRFRVVRKVCVLHSIFNGYPVLVGYSQNPIGARVPDATVLLNSRCTGEGLGIRGEHGVYGDGVGF